MQNAHQVYKHRLPYTKLELVHEIRNEHLIKVESAFQESKGKCILKYLVWLLLIKLMDELTRVGTTVRPKGWEKLMKKGEMPKKR